LLRCTSNGACFLSFFLVSISQHGVSVFETDVARKKSSRTLVIRTDASIPRAGSAPKFLSPEQSSLTPDSVRNNKAASDSLLPHSKSARHVQHADAIVGKKSNSSTKTTLEIIDDDIEDRADPVEDYVRGKHVAPEDSTDEEIDDDDIDDFTAATAGSKGSTLKLQPMAPEAAAKRREMNNRILDDNSTSSDDD
jgi:hypothetical protein